MSVHIPWIDRTNCIYGAENSGASTCTSGCNVISLHFIYCVFYKRSEHEVICNCYPVDQLQSYSGSLPFGLDGRKDAPTVSLCEAAKKQAPWNVFTDNACQCRSACGTNKCRCQRQPLPQWKVLYQQDLQVWMVWWVFLLVIFFINSEPELRGEELVEISSDEEGVTPPPYWIQELVLKDVTRTISRL